MSKTIDKKTYVTSNVVKMGKGPEAWFSTTLLAKQEIYGANTQSQNREVFVKNSVEVPEEAEDADGLQDLINSSESKVSIRVENDMELTTPIEVGEGKEVTLNLNGKTITANNSTAFEVKGGNLTISGGTITGSKRALTVANGGAATVNGGSYTTTSEGQIMNAAGQGSKLTINDGEFNGQEAAVMAFDGAEVVVNGGTFETVDNFVIGTNGSPGRGSNTIIINSGKLTGNITSDGYEACGIYVANNDVVEIGSDVEIDVKNGCGILMRGGSVTVKDGAKINITTDKPAGFTGWVGDNKTKMTQSGVIYHESANYPGKTGMELTIEDGVTINAIDHSIEVLSNEETPRVTVGNGNYTPAYPEV